MPWITAKYREPLDRPETEAIAKRIYALIKLGCLSNEEVALLIKTSRELRKVDWRLARRLHNRPLPSTSLRPLFWDDAMRPSSGVMGCHEIEVWAGWVFRVQDYIDRLEAKYQSKGAALPCNDDDI